MKKVKTQKGSMLAYILVIMSAVLIILTGSLQFISSRIKYSFDVHSKEQAFQAAEAGLNYFKWYLAKNTDGKTTKEVANFWENRTLLDAETTGEEFTDPNGEPIGKFLLEIDEPESYSTIVTVRSKGWTYEDPNITRTIQARLRRPSWSEYMVLVNSMFRLSSGTEVYGRLHSNNGVHFDGVAHNLVTGSVESYYDSDSDVRATKPGVWTVWPNEYNTTLGNDVFLAGKEYPISEEDFNDVLADLASMKEESQEPSGTTINNCSSSGCYFDSLSQGRHIVLNINGTFDTRIVSDYDEDSKDITSYFGNWQTFDIPQNGIIFVENNIWIEGQINDSRVTIVAADLESGKTPDVLIGNDVTYTNYDGSDVIGIIAENNIEIIRNSENDLKIDGALLAHGGKVGREYHGLYCLVRFWLWCLDWEWDSKDLITIFGSIASQDRIGFGYTDGSGYQNRELTYDNNLLYYPPPYFPTGDRYLMDLWEEL